MGRGKRPGPPGGARDGGPNHSLAKAIQPIASRCGQASILSTPLKSQAISLGVGREFYGYAAGVGVLMTVVSALFALADIMRALAIVGCVIFLSAAILLAVRWNREKPEQRRRSASSENSPSMGSRATTEPVAVSRPATRTPIQK